ncbi:D-ribose pyranase [Vagococcus xieshaowenii]|uniref:D-ribose pyranase n=1 Tax=Vagococcus xieshaowenii TaxID=2562451 RepID=A0AAJ5EFZ9_9ENTE|nr:D-ribose pyranase [Vagococcus xieshaowenii]QCA28907.1 D-ribose pyranase [Vagococcus xieshaowenii]TFZ43325.1 D-ribose pyranase [Vagococcus xieshaowenii]
MKKSGLLNSEITKVLADLRHTDQVVIGDCGLPVPENVKEIDLSLKLGTPSFKEVFDLLIEDMKVESAVLATEIKENNPKVESHIRNQIEGISYVSHEEFKVLTQQAKAIIRTGEATPYANILLQAGVIF